MCSLSAGGCSLRALGALGGRVSAAAVASLKSSRRAAAAHFSLSMRAIRLQRVRVKLAPRLAMQPCCGSSRRQNWSANACASADYGEADVIVSEKRSGVQHTAALSAERACLLACLVSYSR